MPVNGTPNINLTAEQLTSEEQREQTGAVLDDFVDEGLASLKSDVRLEVRALPEPIADQVTDEQLESAATAANALPRAVAERHRAIILDRPSPTSFKIGLVNDWDVDARKALARALCTTTQFIKFEKLTEGQYAHLFAYAYGHQSAHESETLAEARETKEWAITGKQGANEARSSTASDVESGAANYGGGTRFSEVTRMVVIDLSNDEEMMQLSQQPLEKLAISDLTRLSIWYFIRAKGSDWHLEHGIRTGSRIRYRHDGVLHPKFKGLPLEIGRRIGNSVSQMAGVDYSDTQRSPKSATITVLISRGGRVEEVELRYASLPTKPLPEYVLRSQSEVINDIRKLGLLQCHYEQVEQMLATTQGMILVTGPTGSGKTNSLAAYRTLIEKPDNRKIVAMEDPIEIYSDYTSQMALSRDNTWEDGFHGMLRFDPDVIIVGELRSKHTVGIALEAATTGHLVFATFHTSNVETTYTRLQKMGIEPEHLSDSLVGIQSQRLARTLCRCKVVDEVESMAHGRALYKPKGCPACLGIGYKGRTALPEILVVNDTIKDWMACGMGGKEIVERAAERGWMKLMEDVAQEKILAGLTDQKEIDRVAKFTEAKSRAQERRAYEDERRARQYHADTKASASSSNSESPANNGDDDAVDAEYWEELHSSAESEEELKVA